MRPAGRTEWAELLEVSGVDYSLSQTYEFGEAVASAYREYAYEPRIVEFEDGLTLLVPLVRVRQRPGFLLRYESMPFSLSGGPVWLGGELTRGHLAAAIGGLRADSLLLNHGGTSAPPASLTGLGETAAVDCTTHMLDLSAGYLEVWERRFSSKVRNQCRTAERKGVEVCSASTRPDFEAYYALYAASAQRWGYAAPPYPLALFQSLASLGEAGVDLKLARAGGRIIAGVVMFRGRNSTLYWGGAMLKEFGHYSPNNALLRSAIEDACRRGLRWFDFGGSERLDSVRKFKESFGARPIGYRNLVFATPRYRLMSGARKALAQVGI